MANTFQVGDLATIAATLVGLDIRLAGLLSRDVEADFGGGRGSTIKVRVPGAVKASSRAVGDKTTSLATSEINEQTVPVTLDDHVYVRIPLSEKDRDLDLRDAASQVVAPAARAIAAEIERRTVETLQATPLNTAIAWDAANPARAFTGLRKALRSAKIADGAALVAVAGLDVEAALLDGPPATFDADGKVRGFDVHYSNRLAPGEIVAFVPEAFTLVVRAPSIPEGAPKGASVRTDTDPRFALRLIEAYNTDVAADEFLLSAFVEVAPMPLAVIDESDGTVDLVPNGGAVRLSISDEEPVA